jgi:hypothetical protein
LSEIDVSKLPDSPKLRRAAVLSQEAIEMTKAWLASGEGVVQKNPVPGAVAYEFRMAPVDLRLILGDCFQNMRAAMDHEVFALSAKRHGKEWADNADTSFPITKTEQSFKSRGRQQIRGLSRAAQDLVEELQPYHNPRHPLAKSLELVHDVARVDRHRLLSLSAAQPESYALNPTTMRANLTIRLKFVMEDTFGGTDALSASRACIVAVAWTIDHLREADVEPVSA